MTPVDDLLHVAVQIAREAGELARTRRAEGVSVAASKTTAVDIVTHADSEVEGLIRRLLGTLRPGDGFYGEETGAEPSTTGLTWVVDPIDGTVNYLYGIPQYAVSIAVIEGEPDPQEWRALAGVVFNPETDELFTATAGGGAHRNGQPISINKDVEPARALVGTGFGYRPEVRVGQARMLQTLLADIRDIRRAGAASLDLCAVACGQLDAYFERGLQPWDHAAGVLIAREAGALALGFEGRQPSQELTLVADAELARFLEKVLLNTASEWAI